MEKLKRKVISLLILNLHKNKSARIVPIALEHYYVHGIPVADTIVIIIIFMIFV